MKKQKNNDFISKKEKLVRHLSLIDVFLVFGNGYFMFFFIFLFGSLQLKMPLKEFIFKNYFWGDYFIHAPLAYLFVIFTLLIIPYWKYKKKLYHEILFS